MEVQKKEKPETQRAHQVFASDGVFHSGHHTKAAAEARAATANKAAKELGLTVTYETREV